MTPEQRAKMIELLDALDTDKMGQRAVVAKQIADLQIEIGKGWGELLAVTGVKAGNLSDHVPGVDFRESAKPQPPTDTDGNPNQAMITRIMLAHEQHGPRMGPWRFGFLEDMLNKLRAGRTLTAAQNAKLIEVLTELDNPKPTPARRAFGAPAR